LKKGVIVAHNEPKLSTGLPNLDRVLRGLIPGDNVTWQIESVDQYRPLVEPFCAHARNTGRHLVYFRFAEDEPLIEEGGAETHILELGRGFEPIITQIQSVIEKAGPGTYYVFDCLSDLAVGWYSDRMLGNFIMLICPYIWEHKGIAYFPVFRGAHSFHAAHLIADTVQVMIDVCGHDGATYLLPHKVERRYSNTMFMLHAWEGDEFRPVAESSINTRVLSDSSWRRQEGPTKQFGFWSRTFARAEEVQRALDRGAPPPEDVGPLLDQLLRMMVRSEGRILELAREHLGLSGLLEVRPRMIGTGPLGGKSVGMLLARSILRKADPSWDTDLEPHDSFYIGADVFYTYLIQNGLWWIKQKQKDPTTFLEGMAIVRLQIRNGSFPEYIMEQFNDLLDYFGQSPIIVRSSSLLEDSYETSFAGKATSIFCCNQGSKEERLDAFVSAVKAVYASGMSEQSLKYRSKHGLLGQDEQMSILVQRVSGKAHGRWFFPDVAGVGLSFNPYVWNAHIEAAAGVVRLVLGLGTRAVGSSDHDFSRLIALNEPGRQPLRTEDDAKRWAQHKVDLLDLESNESVALDFPDVVSMCPDLAVELFATRDKELVSLAASRGRKDIFPWFISFETLIGKTDFVDRMSDMLSTLQEGYGHPIDIEFSANFHADRTYSINLLQCRPMLGRGDGVAAELPTDIDEADRVLEALGPVIGFSREVPVDRIIYVRPSTYSELVLKDRHAIANLIGRLSDLDTASDRRTLLIGPGRWGTIDPYAGIPISFTEISSACAICEIVTMWEGLTPAASLGDHMINELVESNILYFTLYPKTGFLNTSLLEESPNKLTELLPDEARWSHIVRVLAPSEWGDGKILQLNASVTRQRVVCYQAKDRSR
jgi:pyruvate, water dikinase